MISFSHTPDNQIIIVKDDKKYIDSIDAFLQDCVSLKLVYEGYLGYRSLYYKDSILMKTTESAQQREIKPWVFGELIFSRFDELLDAQQKRLNPVKPDPTIEELRAKAVDFIYDRCANLRKLLCGSDDFVEIASWVNKKIIADKYTAKQCSDSDLKVIDSEIALRNKGETRDSFVAKILSNSAKFSLFDAVISGAQRQATDSLGMATSQTYIDSVLSNFDKNISILGVK